MLDVLKAKQALFTSLTSFFADKDPDTVVSYGYPISQLTANHVWVAAEVEETLANQISGSADQESTAEIFVRINREINGVELEEVEADAELLLQGVIETISNNTTLSKTVDQARPLRRTSIEGFEDNRRQIGIELAIELKKW